MPFELVHGLAAAATPFDSPLVPGGFVTKDQGFGHVVFVVPDLDGADRFVQGRARVHASRTGWRRTSAACR